MLPAKTGSLGRTAALQNKNQPERQKALLQFGEFLNWTLQEIRGSAAWTARSSLRVLWEGREWGTGCRNCMPSFLLFVFLRAYRAPLIAWLQARSSYDHTVFYPQLANRQEGDSSSLVVWWAYFQLHDGRKIGEFKPCCAPIPGE